MIMIKMIFIETDINTTTTTTTIDATVTNFTHTIT